MGRPVSIGTQGFNEIREYDAFYVDKTGFIREWWESYDHITLITRPRRFGKTLNMDMLRCFFSTEYAGRSDLFEGLEIWNDDKYRDMQGTWPVIFLSFADIKSATYKSALIRIKETLIDLYKQNRHLIDSDALTENEKKYFTEVENGITDEAAETSVRNLAGYMSRAYGKNVIILLDEYDTPMQEAWVNGYWDEMAVFMRNFFNSTFKTNPYVHRGLMTGITRISKESIFSDLNNLKVITTTSDKYSTCFGFTEKEVSDALDEMGLPEFKEDVKRWYDGFTFGSSKDIYNPWSITNFLDEKKFGAYWAGTSSNKLVNRLIREGDSDVKQKMEDLLAGKTLKCVLDEQIVFNELDETPESIWSLLLASGYLKVVTPPPLTGKGGPEDNTYELALTNFEVREMFMKMIGDWFSKARIQYNEFEKALLAGELKEMNRFMNMVALSTISFFDTGKHPSGTSEPERFYHGLVLGLIVNLRDRYEILSNRESGYGRYDVMMVPLKEGEPAYIMEFKVFDSYDEETLEDTAAAALKQIDEKQYQAQLEAKGILPERIRKYGFAFEGKKVYIAGI